MTQNISRAFSSPVKLVECVPNVSEGRDRLVINAIAAVVRAVSGVTLLDIDAGHATHRTVYTFVGPPAEVSEAAFRLIQKAAELIDMRRHRGEHPRLGATDVCPFVPVAAVTMQECVALASTLGERVGNKLGIPVYLYAEAATSAARKRLPDIRAGEYEGLAEKITRPEWRPDFGPRTFNPRSGATVIGARKFLVAYNVNLNTTDVSIAKKIAADIRESGRFDKDRNVRIPGRFKHCQADGWLIPEYHRAQVTINILDIDATPVHEVFAACCELAPQYGARVTGSEIVGLIPRQVLIAAGTMDLGLSDIAPFDPQQKIIEERLCRAKNSST